MPEPMGCVCAGALVVRRHTQGWETHWVECLTCGRRGPYSPIASRALGMWNVMQVALRLHESQPKESQ